MAAKMFRQCPDTGLFFHKSAESLMKAHAVFGVVYLLLGGALGLLVALTRMPTLHILSAENFYLALSIHGTAILIFWIIFFEMAVLYFASSTLLRTRPAAPGIGWIGFLLMVAGSTLTMVAFLRGNSSVMFTSYVPMPAEPIFYLGLILFAVGALIGCFIFLATLVVAKQEKTYDGSIPLVTFGALTATIIAIFTIASGAVILIPTLLWSLGFINHIDPLMYRTIWWALGHSSQQINVAAHVSIWYAIAAILFGAKPMSEKVSRTAFLLYILFLQLASAHHILADPGVSSTWKVFNTSYAMYLAVLASMIHGLTVPGCIEVAQRKKGFNNGLFEWLRKAPWANPVFSSMFISLIVFGFIGGITGVVMGTEQINLIIHNTIFVPGHFHATVAVGTTMAFMAITFFLIPVLFRRALIWPNVCKWQPYIFGGGMLILILFLLGAGTLGVPRRHWDINFSDAALQFQFAGTAVTMMGIAGLGGLLAAVGGALFCLIAVGSLVFGKRLDPGASLFSSFGFPMAASCYTIDQPGKLGLAPIEQAGDGGAQAKGTFVLALVFLAAFVIYFFINAKYLSSIWPMG
ncbi:MAG: cbb3-type cytochrome c oxidase subunit I [Magnetococcales bacterium]|nr:cbb3-type cytochrome c oxidase subunit I [Magnetococcales bacterium]MBF0262435.1 cbb3-type cytochrome c oxidase subunit I [Magnetococcales bacterium]